MNKPDLQLFFFSLIILFQTFQHIFIIRVQQLHIFKK